MDQSSGQELRDQFSERELAILRLMADGLTNQEISDRLFLAHSTIKWYIRQINAKLDTHSRTQTVARAYKLRLIWDTEPTQQEGEVEAPAEPLANPYKGLRAFQEADTPDFFGRDALVGQLLKRLAESDSQSRFLAVIGPSGSGKSSVVNAGLIPALREGQLPGSERWWVATLFPGAYPLEELEAALLRVAVNPPESLINQLREDELGLLRAVKRVLPRDQGVELVVVIDQFEEVFTLVESEAARVHFLDSLRIAVSDPRSRLYVIVTLRADFLDRPLLYTDFGRLLRRRHELVLPLSVDELKQAIVGPARRVGAQVEADLVGEIVREVGQQPGTLPLLQYVLTELFERRQGRKLMLEAYRAIGGVRQALGRRADELYDSLGEDGRQAARQMFLRLVTLGEGVEDTRRRAPLAELMSVGGDPNVMDQIIQTFAASRLLTLDHDPATSKPTVELAHEALIREWEQLREWLDESRADVRMQRLLGTATAEWQDAGQNIGFLLTGSRLAQFEEWAADTGLALTAEERVYLEASIAERERQVHIEQERQAHEERLVQRSRNLLRALVAVFAVAAIVSGGLALVANSQRLRAENSEQEALRQASIGLAALAENESRKANVERGVLLALEALEYYPYTPQAQSALLESIDALIPVNILTAESIGDSIHTAAWSPSGHYIAGSGPATPKDIVIWDVESGSETIAIGLEIEVFAACDEPASIPFVSWSPSGERLATVVNHLNPEVQFTCGVVVWDPKTGHRQLTIDDADQAGPILSMDWALDGNTLLTGSGNPILTGGKDNRVTLWDAHTGAKLQQFTGHTDRVWDVKFSPDGTLFATASGDSTIRLWDVESGTQLRVLDDHFGEVRSIVWSSDGSQLASGGSDGLPRIWDVQSGEVMLVLPGHTDMIVSVDWSIDGTRIASQSLDGTVRLWDATTGNLALEIPNAGPPIFAAKGFADFSPDGSHLLTADTHLVGQVYLWDITPSVPLLFGHTTGGDYAAWSPDGQAIVTSGYDGTMRIWDSLTGQQVIRRDLRPRGRWGDWSPDSSRIAIPFGGNLTIFDANTGETLAAISPEAKGAGIRFAYVTTDWSPNGSLIAAATIAIGAEQPTFIIDADSYEVLTPLQSDDLCQEGWPHFSPDSTKVATGCAFLGPGTNTPARIWDAQTGEELMSLESEHGWSLHTIWSPDGTRLLVTYEQGVARIWNMETQEVELTYSGHLGWVFSAAWSPDGSFIASSDSTTKHVSIWDSRTGEDILSFAVPSNINTISWSPDGNYVILFGDSITEPIIKRVWRSTDELIAHAYECCVSRELTPDERAQFGLPERQPR